MRGVLVRALFWDVSRGTSFFCFQAEDGIRYLVRSRGLGDVYKRQMEEWEDLAPDLASLVHIVEEKVIDYERQAVKVNDLSLIHI